MKFCLRVVIQKSVWLGVLTFAVVSSSAVPASEAAEEGDHLQFWADARVYSVIPGQELTTYRSNSGGGVGPRGTLTLGTRRFNVQIEGKLKENRFLAKVEVTPQENEKDVKPQQLDWDLSDLQPRILEVTRDEDGRVHRLKLIPTIMVHPQPKQFSIQKLFLENFSFASSPVVLNDEDYLGILSMSSGPMAWCDIPGVAKIEFSLSKLKDSLPIGTLENGVINIRHDSGTTLRISGVKNGADAETLAGGPFRVWVRWTKPTQTTAEYQAELSQLIESLRKRSDSGEDTFPKGTLERLQRRSDTGRIAMIDSGVGPIEDDEPAEPKK